MAERVSAAAASPGGGDVLAHELHLLRAAGRAHRHMAAEMVAPIRNSEKIVDEGVKIHEKNVAEKLGKNICGDGVEGF